MWSVAVDNEDSTMNDYIKIVLKPGKEAAVKRFHPWIFSGAIRNIQGRPSAGDVVEIYSAAREYLATGHYQEDSIAVKIVSFQECAVDLEFWTRKLNTALSVRQRIGVTNTSVTNAYRLINTEGDGLPGLIVDYYNGVAVVQAHSQGMGRALPLVVEGLKAVYGDDLKAVYNKSSDTLHPANGKGGKETESLVRDSYLFGGPSDLTVQETGHHFHVDVEKGQKTGFFLDQRGNRMFAQFYAKDKKILNAFAYSGAFSVYALKGGATVVHSVDSSKQAIAWASENVELNRIKASRHLGIVADVKKYLVEADEMYDMIILDPPAFAKHHNVSHNALMAYQFINASALKKLNKGGLLFTFSCSQAINRELFHSALRSAALESGREIRLLHQLSQGPDHPVNIYHPEGEYLKGLILMVE